MLQNTLKWKIGMDQKKVQMDKTEKNLTPRKIFYQVRLLALSPQFGHRMLLVSRVSAEYFSAIIDARTDLVFGFGWPWTPKPRSTKGSPCISRGDVYVWESWIWSLVKWIFGHRVYVMLSCICYHAKMLGNEMGAMNAGQWNGDVFSLFSHSLLSTILQWGHWIISFAFSNTS